MPTPRREDFGGNGALCQSLRGTVTLGEQKRVTSSQGCAVILQAATGLPEEIFKAGQLVAR